MRVRADPAIAPCIGPAHFLNAQERIQLLSHPGQYETASLPRSRSATPAAAKHGRVDYGAVRRSLQELWQTEESYLRKIQSLYNVSRWRTPHDNGDVRLARH